MQTQAADLALRGLSKAYGPVVAVDGVSLHIRAGEMVALLGPSGCGKTTTLRMIAGLIAPSAGDIRIGDRSIVDVPVHRRNIGMLFQNYALFPHLSVRHNVAFGLEMRGIRRTEATRRVEEALQLVQLAHLTDRLPSALSGGQQQRVALARALVIEPSVLLLDEPLGALDKGLRESMQVELRSLQQRLGITSVIVTHDQEEALTLADRIVVMRAGKLEQVGTPREIYARPVSRFVAGFIGAANFLRGTFSGVEDGFWHVALAGGAAALVSPSDSGIPPSQITIAVRPEAVQVGAPCDDAVNSLRATVTQVIYRGGTTHLYLRPDSGEKLVAFQHAGGVAVSPGDAVQASWSPRDACVVTET